MAGRDVAGRLLFERRGTCRQSRSPARSAGEDAALDALLEARHQAGNLGEPRRLARERGAELRHRAEQALRIGMARAANSSATGASSTLRPAYMTMTRSAISATTPRSWVMSTIAAPDAALESRIRSRICAWIVTSSAVVGSSAIRSFGLQASAMAIITRWRMPPESWCGYSRTRRSGSGMPTSVSISTARALGRLLDRAPGAAAASRRSGGRP